MSYARHSAPPCKGCEDRNEKCHSNCWEYREWSENRRAKEDSARRQYFNEKRVTDYLIESAEKKKRR